MKIYTIKETYINYLKLFDSRVPNVNYAGRMKPFIGIVLHAKSGYDYFCPLTSYKPKFTAVNDTITFMKITDQRNNHILGALKFNYMIPVPKHEVIEINEQNLDEFISFSTAAEKSKYWNLLNLELRIINKQKYRVLSKAERLYDICLTEVEQPINNYCLNFNLLDQKCRDFEMQKCTHLYPAENINQLLVTRYLADQGKCLYPYNQKYYVIDIDHANLSLNELDHYYGESFFHDEYISYAQFLYQNMDAIKVSNINYTIDEQRYLNITKMELESPTHSTIEVYEYEKDDD